MWNYAGWSGMLLMSLLWILLIAAIIFVIVKLVENRAPAAPQQGKNDRAYEILKERLARGEIDTEEFEAKKKLLKD